MPYNAQGLWEPEDDAVSTKLTGLLSKDNPVITQARTAGLAFANRRGLANSSMAAQATEAAAYGAAVPIASQEASQIAAKNLSAQGFRQQTGLLEKDIASKEGIAQLNVAAHDREKSTSAAVAMENAYAEVFRTIGQQHELPADARNTYLQHISLIRDSNLNLIEQLYGIDLDWATPNVVGAGNTPSSSP